MKRFLPLIFISLLVMLFAAGHTLWLPGGIGIFMQYLMAGYFLIFGLLKITNWTGFVQSYQRYDWLAGSNRFYALAYPGLEVALGVMYYLDLFLVWLNVFVFFLMLEKGLSVYRSIRAKKISTCACLGGRFSIPITYVTVFEDILMAGMALWMLLHYV
jgi:hypothetical protein